MPKQSELTDNNNGPVIQHASAAGAHVNVALEHKLQVATPKLSITPKVERVGITSVTNAGTIVEAKEIDVKK